MIFCTDTHFIHKSLKKNPNQTSFTKSLILPNITNKLISTKLRPNISLLILVAKQNSLIDNGVQPIVVIVIRIML